MEQFNLRDDGRRTSLPQLGTFYSDPALHIHPRTINVLLYSPAQDGYLQQFQYGVLDRSSKMVGKKSGKALLREEGKLISEWILINVLTCWILGLERTDNGMKQSSWPEVQMINQKNYYTFVPLCKEPSI